MAKNDPIVIEVTWKKDFVKQLGCKPVCLYSFQARDKDYAMFYYEEWKKGDKASSVKLLEPK